MRAFFNPLSSQWERVPKGYEAPMPSVLHKARNGFLSLSQSLEVSLSQEYMYIHNIYTNIYLFPVYIASIVDCLQMYALRHPSLRLENSHMPKQLAVLQVRR